MRLRWRLERIDLALLAHYSRSQPAGHLDHFLNRLLVWRLNLECTVNEHERRAAGRCRPNNHLKPLRPPVLGSPLVIIGRRNLQRRIGLQQRAPVCLGNWMLATLVRMFCACDENVVAHRALRSLTSCSDPAPRTFGTEPRRNRGVRCVRFVRTRAYHFSSSELNTVRQST